MATSTPQAPRPTLTVDCVVFGFCPKGLRVLLVERSLGPSEVSWGVPGGPLRGDETTDCAARRELQAQTGLEQVFLEQLYTFSDIHRDPRERVITVAHYALVGPDVQHEPSGEVSRVLRGRWFPVAELPELAWDHGRIIQVALERLRGKVRRQPIGFELLPDKFTLGALQRLYETVLGRPLDKRNFRRSILQMGILDDLGERETGVCHRPSRLYRFNPDAYARLLENGFVFEM